MEFSVTTKIHVMQVYSISSDTKENLKIWNAKNDKKGEFSKIISNFKNFYLRTQ